MLYKLRQQKPDVSFAILQLPIEIIFEKLCFFSDDNASKRENYTKKDGIAYLRNMFESPFDKTREITKIPNHYPTSPEAEIQILGIINASLIQRILFNDLEVLQRYTSKLAVAPLFEVDSLLFKGRMDWEFWKTR